MSHATQMYHSACCCRNLPRINIHYKLSIELPNTKRARFRRAASFAHARAAVSRVLDDGCRTLTGKAILLVAVAELQDYFSDEVHHC